METNKETNRLMGTNKDSNNENVFVYGTLKKGYGNNKAFLADSYSFYCGSAISCNNSYQLYCNGGFPMAIDLNSTGFYKIKGEIYNIDQYTLGRLDILEGNGSLYIREKRDFILNNNTIVKAWIYLFNDRPWNYSIKNNNIIYSLDIDGNKVVEWIRKQ